jgi:cytochrome c-type biogenesis protein CcmE
MSETPKKSVPLRRRKRRLLIVGLLLPTLLGAAALTLVALQQTSVYFYNPKDLPSPEELAGRTVRIGGLVTEGSIKQGEGVEVSFDVTDLASTVTVVYNDMLPGLFRANQGVVVQGTLAEDGTFVASKVMAKHDENYMAPEVEEALKASGRYEEYQKSRKHNAE